MTDLEDRLSDTLLAHGDMLSVVIEALSNVCKARADSDEAHARLWNDAAVRLDRQATAIERLGL
jgi:hypothetical protein